MKVREILFEKKGSEKISNPDAVNYVFTKGYPTVDFCLLFFTVFNGYSYQIGRP
jgi:hypothetical protein